MAHRPASGAASARRNCHKPPIRVRRAIFSSVAAAGNVLPPLAGRAAEAVETAETVADSIQPGMEHLVACLEPALKTGQQYS